MENPELELDRIADRLAAVLWVDAPRLFAYRAMRQALDQAVATVQPTRSEFETDMISPSVSGLEGRVTILEDQVSRLFEKLNTAAGILI